MREVTKAEFFAAIGARNIHPDAHDPEVTIWRDQRTRAEAGRTKGWRVRGSQRYYLLDEVSHADA